MFSSDKRLVAAACLHAHMDLDGMKCDADLQAWNDQAFRRAILGQDRTGRLN